MKQLFDFEGLYVLDMANNHQGSVEHALRIIRQHGEVVAKHGVRAALKFQFRHFETFIHPAHKEGSDNKHIPRFLANALSDEAYGELAEAVRKAGMVTMATPFDEDSLDLIDRLGIEVIKIASCSALDWPLMEAVSTYNKPVIVSTGGLRMEEIDDVVSFLEHRKVSFALMHCVAIYPTPLDLLQLNQIEVLRRRYPKLTVGFSTHEPPEDDRVAMVAVAKGARMLERHVGVGTDEISLNAYSSTPEHLDAWIRNAGEAGVMCGASERPPSPEQEQSALESLRRGVYLREDAEADTLLERERVYFAMPIGPGQLSSGQWNPSMKLKAQGAKDSAVKVEDVQFPPKPAKHVLVKAVHEVKSMLNEACIALPVDFSLEFSHHYGVGRFREVGAVLIDCVNRAYCKKLVIELPGQSHPNHYHKRKEETFQVLSGVLKLNLEGKEKILYPGDTQVVPQGVWHSFSSDTGVIFEEVSTTHLNDDSFYEDKEINAVERSFRKTVVSQWGRYQIND